MKKKNTSQAVKGGGSSKSASLTASDKSRSDQIRRQAVVNAKAARESIGEDTLHKFSATAQQSKTDISHDDAQRLIAEFLIMIDEA